MKRKQSSGEAGERAAELWFRVNGWHMTRTQPETRTVWAKGRPVVVNCGSGGVADYTGYRLRPIDKAPIYAACEVKEASADTMPCSRLTKEQRDWMESIPDMCRFVGILWPDGTFSVLPYKAGRGAYVKPSAVV